jgi:hypothetical protein
LSRTNQVISLHRIDDTNIGDYYSAPARYFSFPDNITSYGEILKLTPADLTDKCVILGGGGLLDQWFMPSFMEILRSRPAKLIAWGIGQQLDTDHWYSQHHQFNYKSYLSAFDLVGIRDYGYDHTWVPCASCMNSSFNKVRDAKHEFVVFSHKSRPIPIRGFPCMTNETNDLNDVLDFLGSGDTILTSSYHGVYWGLLLNRKVLAFPFNSKFLTFKQVPAIYPARWMKKSLLGRFRNDGYKLEMVKGWRILAGAARNYPEALEECRDANRNFHARVLDVIK